MSVISRIVVSSVSLFAAATLLAAPSATAATIGPVKSITGPVIIRPYPVPISPCGPIFRPIIVLRTAITPSMIMCPLSE